LIRRTGSRRVDISWYSRTTVQLCDLDHSTFVLASTEFVDVFSDDTERFSQYLMVMPGRQNRTDGENADGNTALVMEHAEVALAGDNDHCRDIRMWRRFSICSHNRSYGCGYFRQCRGWSGHWRYRDGIQ
jgi:hypothetical protein